MDVFRILQKQSLPDLVILLILFFSTNASGQYTIVHSKGIQKPSKVSIDQAGNIYIATFDGDIIRLDPGLQSELVFSPQIPGATSVLEAWQGLRIFTFHKELQLYRLINRNLSLHEDYNFNPDLVGFAEVAAPTFDNNVWAVDQFDFSLKKLNIRQSRIENVTPLNLLLNPADYEILHCKEYQNRLFISTKNKGILIFDNFGNFIKTYPFQDVDYFNFLNDELYFIRDNRLTSIELYSDNISESVLPSEGRWLFALRFKNLLYLFSEENVFLYK